MLWIEKSNRYGENKESDNEISKKGRAERKTDRRKKERRASVEGGFNQ